MSCLHVRAFQFACSPLAFQRSAFQVNKLSRLPSTYLGTKLPKISLKLTSATSRYQHVAPICLFGGKGKSEDANEQTSPWKTLEKAMGNFKKEQSVEDVLKQQIQKQEYYDGGAGGSGGGGGSGDDGKRPSGGGGFGEADEGLSGMLDEFSQVMLATIGFIFLYIYIIETEEITVLAKDLIKFPFAKQKSMRLMRVLNQWSTFIEWLNETFFQRLTEKEEDDPNWLERAIILTPTMYDSPEKYKRIIYKAYMDSKSDDEEEGYGYTG